MLRYFTSFVVLFAILSIPTIPARAETAQEGPTWETKADTILDTSTGNRSSLTRHDEITILGLARRTLEPEQYNKINASNIVKCLAKPEKCGTNGHISPDVIALICKMKNDSNWMPRNGHLDTYRVLKKDTKLIIKNTQDVGEWWDSKSSVVVHYVRVLDGAHTNAHGWLTNMDIIRQETVAESKPLQPDTQPVKLVEINYLTYLIEGEDYYIAQEWTINGVHGTGGYDYKVVHIPDELRHKYVQEGGTGSPNVAVVGGVFQYNGNVRGVNQYGGPCMIESYTVPGPGTRAKIDAQQKTFNAAQLKDRNDTNHNYRVKEIAHTLERLNNIDDLAMDPGQPNGKLNGLITLLSLYNEELGYDTAKLEVIRSNITITEANVRSLLQRWINHLTLKMQRARANDIDYLQKELLGLRAQWQYLDTHNVQERQTGDFTTDGHIAPQMERAFYRAQEKPQATSIEPIGPTSSDSGISVDASEGYYNYHRSRAAQLITRFNQINATLASNPPVERAVPLYKEAKDVSVELKSIYTNLLPSTTNPDSLSILRENITKTDKIIHQTDTKLKAHNVVALSSNNDHETRKARAAYLIGYITERGNEIDRLNARGQNPRNYWRAIIDAQNELLNIYKIGLRNSCSIDDENAINILEANIDKITSGREFAWNAIKNCR